VRAETEKLDLARRPHRVRRLGPALVRQPLGRLRATVEGAYFISAEETVDRPGDALPRGFPFYPEDSAGYVRVQLRANVVEAPRYALELFLVGTIPIDVDLAKFSNVHIHYASGGGTLRAHLTAPDDLVRLDGAGTMFIGSGAYDGTFQHNAQLGLDAMVGLSFRRWLLPWRVTIMAGPAFLADLDEQINDVYREAYSVVSPDLMAGDRVQQMQLAVRIRPTFAITKHAALDLRFDGQLAGADARATQIYTAALRAAF
jgi:hypothetical protein